MQIGEQKVKRPKYMKRYNTDRAGRCYPPPVPVVRRFRVARFDGGAASVVVGEVVSKGCLRFRDEFDSAGVFTVDVGVDEDAVEGAFCEGCCGMVLCAFCGELCADGGGFCGELIEAEGVCDWRREC